MFINKKATENDTDSFYTCPSEQLASFYAKQNMDVYHYKFLKLGHCQDYGKVFLNEKNYGVPKLRSYWSNFIKNNNPNDDSKNPQWPTYGNQRKIMNFGTNFYISNVNRGSCYNKP